MFLFSWFRNSVKKAILDGVQDAIKELTEVRRDEPPSESLIGVQRLMDEPPNEPAGEPPPRKTRK